MSDKERLEGLRQLGNRIREEFSQAGKDVESIKWTVPGGGRPSSWASYSIIVTVDGKELTLSRVPDSSIIDYPGGAKDEKLHALIRSLVKKSLDDH